MKPAVAAGAPEALFELEKAHREGRPYQLVILDRMMPKVDGLELAEEIRQRPELVGPTLMMLSSADRREAVARCEELGIQACMMKPIRRTELFSAILKSLGARHGAGSHLGLEKSARPLRILLAEDDLVNQKLAVRLLEKRGHEITVANNGREAVSAVARQPFDLVLMDIEMPELDGIEATAEIR
jgi:CheY-like chemotaxis protein